jgi:hypothetical protein
MAQMNDKALEELTVDYGERYQPPHLTHDHNANHRGIIPSQQARVLDLGRWAKLNRNAT